MDPWDDITADRLRFADYLQTLDAGDWETESLCRGWTVKGVTTHLLVTPTMSKGKVFTSFLASGFNLDKMSAKLIAQMTAAMSTDDIITTTRDTAGSRSTPPGLKPLGVLGEVLTHTADVSFALDKPFALPVEHYVSGLDHLKGVQPVLGCRKRIEGLRLQATDAEWTWGSGPSVEGSAQALVAAMTGRRAVLDQLTGEGVEVLRGR
jgi:uncharacterized protein (TIGR03083 family)